MHPGSHKPDTAGDLARYFNNAQQLSQHETLGQIVAEILRSGSNLNRTAIVLRSAPDSYVAWNWRAVWKKNGIITN